MKKIVAMTLAIMFLVSTLAFAGGDQNKNRNDGSKGQGSVVQVRTNK